jgi:mycoredoxin
MSERSSEAPRAITAIDVYRRNGCGFCMRLERRLAGTRLPVRYHDIWADDEARAFVRVHNRGHETVPTVAIGTLVLTNPSFGEVEAAVTDEAPHLLG